MTQQRDIERLLDTWFSDGPIRHPIASSTSSPTGSNANPSDPRGASDWRPFPVNAYVEARGRRGGRPRSWPSSATTCCPAGRPESVARLRRRRHHRPTASASPSAPASPTRRVPGLVHASRALEPGSCRWAARRPGRSCPASRSRCRRAGSTPAMRPISTGCSRTRPPMRPKTPRSGDLAQRALHGAACEPVFRLRRVGGQSGRDGGRDGRRRGCQRSPCDVRAGRRDDRWPDRQAGRRPARSRLDGQLSWRPAERWTSGTSGLERSFSTPRIAVSS